jgi:hypothetical protein
MSIAAVRTKLDGQGELTSRCIHEIEGHAVKRDLGWTASRAPRSSAELRGARAAEVCHGADVQLAPVLGITCLQFAAHVALELVAKGLWYPA